jgi:hypothetical protein
MCDEASLETTGFDMTKPLDEGLRFKPPRRHKGYGVVKRGKLLSERPVYYYGTAYEQAVLAGGYVVTWEHFTEKAES